MKKSFITLASILALSSWMTACGSTKTDFPEPPATTAASETSSEAETKAEKAAAFSTGSWDEYTFTSPWLGLTFTFPEDCTIGTEEDIREILGTGQEALINNGVTSEAQAKISDFNTAYDFMVTLSDQSSNLQLIHENVSVATLGKGVSAEEYLKIVMGQLGAMEDYGYEFGEFETVTLGSQTFKKLPVSAFGGATFQDYYCISNGKYVSIIIASYLPDSADTMNSIISGITDSQ